MDLLYQKKRYNEVVKLYEVLLERPFSAGRYAKDCMVLALAALHKVVSIRRYNTIAVDRSIDWLIDLLYDCVLVDWLID